MKKSVIVIVALLMSVLSFSQQAESGYNKYDENGNKTGLWITQDEYRKNFANYKNGNKDGVSYNLDTDDGTLDYFVRYSNGELVDFYCFYDTGGLAYRMFDFMEFEIELKTPYKGYTWDKAPDRICHSVDYYPNGNIKSEGDIIFWSDSDIEIDFIEYGEWKYYNEDGTLKEKREKTTQTEVTSNKAY